MGSDEIWLGTAGGIVQVAFVGRLSLICMVMLQTDPISSTGRNVPISHLEKCRHSEWKSLVAMAATKADMKEGQWATHECRLNVY